MATGALDETRSACQKIINGVPLDQLQVAQTEVRAALDEVIAAGSCHHPDYRAALDGLTALQADLDAIQGRLLAAAGHARHLLAKL